MKQFLLYSKYILEHKLGPHIFLDLDDVLENVPSFFFFNKDGLCFIFYFLT